MSERLFALAVRVDVCGIEEINAILESNFDQLVGSLLVDGADHLEEALAATKGHGAEAKARNEESGIA